MRIIRIIKKYLYYEWSFMDNAQLLGLLLNVYEKNQVINVKRGQREPTIIVLGVEYGTRYQKKI